MTVSVDSRAYEAIHDPAELRVAVRELRRVRAWIGQFADVAAEMPGYDLQQVAAAKNATAAVVGLLIERAESRLRALSMRVAPPEVVVVDAARRQVVDDPVGFALAPMVTEPMVMTRGVSSAVLRLDAGETTLPHWYPDVDVILVVIFGAVDVVWWDAAGEPQQVTVRRHQHAHVRRGTRHRLENSGAVQLLAVQVRAGADVTAGMAVAPELPSEFALGLDEEG